MNELFANHSCYEDEEDNITAYIESNLGVYFYDQIGFHYLYVAPFPVYSLLKLHCTKQIKKGFQIISCSW